MTHTPGPWTTPADDMVTHRLGNIATVCKPDKYVEGSQADNACLIAAAPDLLEACKAARELYDQLATDTDPVACAVKHGPDYQPWTQGEWEERCREIRHQLETAIAAAEPEGELRR